MLIYLPVTLQPLIAFAERSSFNNNIQGALKGTNLRGQTEPKRRFSQIFADSRRFLENKARREKS